jgi:hypothetical protein
VEKGDTVILHPKYVPYPPHPHEGRKAIVEEIETLHIRVSLPDFSNCNHRELYNRFWYTPEEVEVEKE